MGKDFTGRTWLFIIISLSLFLLIPSSNEIIFPQNISNVNPSFNLKNNLNNSLFYVQEDGRVGMGLTAPQASLHILGMDGFLFAGNLNKGAELNPGPGVKMMWYPRKGAFRAGSVDGRQWDDRNIGLYSVAAGYMTLASGDYSVALGINNTASGQASIALGRNSVSTSFFSAAIGFYASALNENAFALGYHSVADAKFSFAIGHKSSTNGKYGSFAISDASSQNSLLSSSDNEMNMRFAGGYRLFSDNTGSGGVFISPGGISWSTPADLRKMANIKNIDSEMVLSKISMLSPVSWSIRGSKGIFRHYGVSAQSFYRYFGSDSIGTIGNDSTISSSDFDGITLAALKGLEKRTSVIFSTMAAVDTLVRVLQEKDSLLTNMNYEILMLREKLAQRELEIEKLNERFDRVEAALELISEPKGRKEE